MKTTGKPQCVTVWTCANICVLFYSLLIIRFHWLLILWMPMSIRQHLHSCQGHQLRAFKRTLTDFRKKIRYPQNNFQTPSSCILVFSVEIQFTKNNPHLPQWPFYPINAHAMTHVDFAFSCASIDFNGNVCLKHKGVKESLCKTDYYSCTQANF